MPKLPIPLGRRLPFKGRYTLPLVALTVVVGVVAVIFVFAAGPFTVFEPESATLTTGATEVTRSGASGGKTIRFGAVPTPTPAPTPTPPASGSCAPYPSFPDAACTGPSGPLQQYTESLDFDTPGQVVENKWIRLKDRGIGVYANNVTFRNVLITWEGTRGGDFTMVNLNYVRGSDRTPVSGTKFENCEVIGNDNNNTDGNSSTTNTVNIERAISGVGNNVTVRGCDIHHAGNGVEVSGPLLVEESYIHDIVTPAGEEWHADGIQIPYGGDNITLRHNTIILTGSETSAVSAEGEPNGSDPADNVLIEHNLFAGGVYTMYTGPGSNYRVINNHFSTRIWPKVGCVGIWHHGGVTRSGNVIHETGAAANDNTISGLNCDDN